MSKKEIQLDTPLKLNEIDFRVQSINKGKVATLLAYKDARVDMKRLDEVLGPENWQRDYKVVGGLLMCGIGIMNKDLGQFIWKWDTGTESNTEKEKGHASDAFKRACFNLGIGRELYDYPLIEIQLHDNEVYQDQRSQNYRISKFKFDLKNLEWVRQMDGSKVVYLACKKDGKIRFEYGQINKDLETEIIKEELNSNAASEPFKSVVIDEKKMEVVNKLLKAWPKDTFLQSIKGQLEKGWDLSDKQKKTIKKKVVDAKEFNLI